MHAPVVTGSGLSTGRLVKLLALLWFAGLALRAPLLAVPPVVPLIHHDLAMNQTQVGLLISLPLMIFALASIPGSLLIARFGALQTLITGIFIIALAGAARGAAPDVMLLYVATLVMGIGMAVVQPALPSLVKQWMPDRIVLGTAVSTNGMVVGVAASAALTTTLVLPNVGGSWRLDLVVWSAPVLMAGLLFMLFAPSPAVTPQAMNDNEASPRLWWPDWHNPLIWLLGLTFGSNNAFFYCVNAFLPDYLTHTGQIELVGAALAWCNGAQLVASLILLGTADRLQRRAWPYLVFGPLALLGMAGVVCGSGFLVVAAAGLVGFALAITFVTTLALPAMLAPAADVHRLASGMFTITYTTAVIVPVVSGMLWDLTGIHWIVFLPTALCGIALTGLGFFLSTRFLRSRSTALS